MPEKRTYEELEKRVKDLQEDEAEHKQAEAMLREILERFNEAERIGNFGYWSQDFETGEQWWSKNEYLIHDLPENTKPNYDLYLDCVHPDERSDLDRSFKEAWEFDSKDFSLE